MTSLPPLHVILFVTCEQMDDFSWKETLCVRRKDCSLKNLFLI